MPHLATRRDFLRTGAAIGAGYWIAGAARAAESDSPNERIRFGCIGVGGKGLDDAQDAGRFGDVVAICDVDQGRLDRAAAMFPAAKKYYDFREMLDETAGRLDAVTVSTPDHTHAAAAAMAMRMRKHCFCQKPLTRTIYEARRLRELARENHLATQMGNQGTAAGQVRKAAAVVASGALGDIEQVHVWTNRPIWPQGHARPESSPPPPHVHWDQWLGPAEPRPYANGFHPFSWRGYWDFGTGALGDMGCHVANMPYMALGLRDPAAVVAETSGHNRQSLPKWSIITYEFPATDQRPALKMIWYDGGKLPKQELFHGEPIQNNGVLVVGSQGTLYGPGGHIENGHKLLGGPNEGSTNEGSAVEPEVKYDESPGHFEEWVRAIRGGPPATSNFPDYAGPLTETILLGNLAVWMAREPGLPGKRIEWDAQLLTATNVPEVADLIKPTYRDGYVL